MFCTKCGNPLHDGDKFCAHCGAKVREDIAREASDSQKYEEVVFNPLSDRKQRGGLNSLRKRVPTARNQRRKVYTLTGI